MNKKNAGIFYYAYLLDKLILYKPTIQINIILFSDCDYKKCM